MRSVSTRRWKKNTTRKEKQLKYSIDERMVLTKENKNDFNILLGLYFYRALSSDQIYRLGLTTMKKNTLWSKMVYLTERRVVKTLVDTDKPTGSLNSKFRYVLTDLGLEIILDALNIPRKKKGHPKHHYSLMDLRLGSQKKHHYLSVDWISRVQQSIRSAGIIAPDSEWRRYFSGDPNTIATTYKPDWMMYEPHIGNQTIVENGSYELHPFIYPLQVRDEYLNDLYKALDESGRWKWRDFYKPMLVLEMDTGTMSHKDLALKYQGIQESMSRDPEYFPNVLVFCNYVERFSPRLNKETGDNHILDIRPNSKKRLRNTRHHISEILHTLLVQDELMILHGDECESVSAASDYINRERTLIPNDMREVLTIKRLAREARTNMQVVTPQSQEGKAWRDLTNYGPGLPDFMVIEDSEKLTHERFESASPKNIDFIYIARNCWVNPQVKASTFAKWLSTGGDWPNVLRTRVILLYPTVDEFQRDTFPIQFDKGIYFASYEEVESERSWGSVYARIPVYKKGIRWEKIEGSLMSFGEEDDDDD